MKNVWHQVPFTLTHMSLCAVQILDCKIFSTCSIVLFHFLLIFVFFIFVVNSLKEKEKHANLDEFEEKH